MWRAFCAGLWAMPLFTVANHFAWTWLESPILRDPLYVARIAVQTPIAFVFGAVTELCFARRRQGDHADAARMALATGIAGALLSAYLESVVGLLYGFAFSAWGAAVLWRRRPWKDASRRKP